MWTPYHCQVYIPGVLHVPDQEQRKLLPQILQRLVGRHGFPAIPGYYIYACSEECRERVAQELTKAARLVAGVPQ